MVAVMAGGEVLLAFWQAGRGAHRVRMAKRRAAADLVLFMEQI
jgi:hypothetical protein